MPKTSPSGHIPLNKETLSDMENAERAFWEEFLAEVMAVINTERERGTPPPYNLPPELILKFQTAIDVYDGDKYCQVHQIKELFSLTSIVH